MIKKFINWFKINHEYRTKHVDFDYYHNILEILPTISIITGTVADNGIEIGWLWFGIWFHSAEY